VSTPVLMIVAGCPSLSLPTIAVLPSGETATRQRAAAGRDGRQRLEVDLAVDAHRVARVIR
jgi:hypothetical protein